MFKFSGFFTQFFEAFAKMKFTRMFNFWFAYKKINTLSSLTPGGVFQNYGFKINLKINLQHIEMSPTT